MFNRQGFTLIELVMSITIVAILGTIGFISFTASTSDARDTVRQTHATDINTVMRLTKVNTGQYPDPTNSFDVTYSGATVWTQGSFGTDTMAQTGKIFGDLIDPKYETPYTYSVTNNRREYQLAMVFEDYDEIGNLSAFLPKVDFSIAQVNASSTFDPSIYFPIIWLSSDDLNGDGNLTNNPATGTPVSSWQNKGLLGNAGDPTITGDVNYEAAILNGYNSVVVDKDAGILLNNSEITSGEIYYVLNKTNKAVGAGMRGVQEGYHIGPWHNCVDSININGTPEFYANLSGGKKDPYFYSFYTDDENYTFRTNGNNLGYSGPNPSSIGSVTWAFNAAGYPTELQNNPNGEQCAAGKKVSASDIAIGEILIFDAENSYPMTEEDRLKIEGYLAWKWGLQGQLPSDHPYKNAPPEGPADEGEIETLTADSNVYVTGDYNGLLVHGVDSGDVNYVLAAPSIITYDSSDTDLASIISNSKFVYDRYHNIPSTYEGTSLTMSGGFNFYSAYPLLYEGTTEQVGSYAGLSDINQQLRYKYRSSVVYPDIEPYFIDHDLGYLENILGAYVGINPIQPYYCSDIQESKFTFNIATEAGLGGNAHATEGYGLPALTNGIIDTTGDLDYEYHSETGSGYIELTWAEDKEVGFVRIYNRVNQDSDQLTGATFTLYDSIDTVLYTHDLWDTSSDYLVDFDLQQLGEYYSNVRKLRLETVDGNPLHIREIEVFIGGDVQDGYYKVDRDGAGGLGAYEVYCDMTTDGGGWTRVGDNYIDHGDFSGGQHSDNYSLLYPASNTPVVKNSPSDSGYALWIRDTGEDLLPANINYELDFTNLSPFEVGNEIRLSAWVAEENDDAGTGNVFSNLLTYTDTTTQSYDTFEIIDTQVVDSVTWTHQMVRITIEQDVSSFVWNVGKYAEFDTGRSLYVTDLKAEVYYK